MSIGPRSLFMVSTLTSVHGFRFALAAWNSTSPAPGHRSNVGHRSGERPARPGEALEALSAPCGGYQQAMAIGSNVPGSRIATISVTTHPAARCEGRRFADIAGEGQYPRRLGLATRPGDRAA